MVFSWLLDSAIISEKERWTTAWHEAGHTLVAMSLPKEHVDPIHKVTISSRTAP